MTTSRSSAARCSRRAPRTHAGSTCSASAARSTPTSRARCSRPAAPRASACACTPTSSASGPGSGWRSRWGPPRPITAPTCPRADVDALAGSDTVATLLPATDFSTRQPYPDAPAPARRGRDGRARHQLQPRLELHDLDELLHRARRPRDADDGRRGARRRRRSAAPRRCGGPTSAGCGRARAPTRSCSSAPSYLHIVYRAGMPLVAATISAASCRGRTRSWGWRTVGARGG